MSLVTVLLRWDHVAPQQHQQVACLGDQLPLGCLSRNVSRQGTVLRATEVWDTEEAGERIDHLVNAVREAGVEEPAQVAMFSVPQMFVPVYRRSAPAPSIPRQPGPPAREQRSGIAAAG